MQFFERKHYECIKDALKSGTGTKEMKKMLKCKESKKEMTDLELENP